jgi:hypothetical protein
MASLSLSAVDGIYGLSAGNGDGASCLLLPEVRGATESKNAYCRRHSLVSLPNRVQIGDMKTHVCVFAGSES